MCFIECRVCLTGLTLYANVGALCNKNTGIRMLYEQTNMCIYNGYHRTLDLLRWFVGSESILESYAYAETYLLPLHFDI